MPPNVERAPFAFAPPKIAESSGAELRDYRGYRSGETSVATGCVASAIPGWVEDMRPAVEARTTALVGAIGERMSGNPMDVRLRPDGGEVLVLRPASRLDDPPVGVAKRFLGFGEGRVFTCFAVCEGTGCEFVETAHLEGTEPPPAPGLALGAVTWGVHHPRPTAEGAALFLVFAGVVAVITRRRPQSRT